MQPHMNWIADPEVSAVNRLAAHFDHCWYQTQQEMETSLMDLRQSLNGSWQFLYSPTVHQRPSNFWAEDADHSQFVPIQVPGHMELQGHGQIQYVNTMYPWDGRCSLRPPHIDWNDSPVGSYVCRFDLQPSLQDKRVCLCFEGVEQAFFVWLNSQFVGYSEDSFTPAHFDVTDLVRPTGNLLCVEVHKHSSAGWLEDQDFFRFSGIFRPVYLYGKPPIHIEDLWLRADLAPDLTTGTLSPRLRLSGQTQGARITCTVTDPLGRCLLEESIDPAADQTFQMPNIHP